MKNAEHASKLTLAEGYTAKRLSLAHPIIDAEIFTIRPKKAPSGTRANLVWRGLAIRAPGGCANGSRRADFRKSAPP